MDRTEPAARIGGSRLRVVRELPRLGVVIDLLGRDLRIQRIQSLLISGGIWLI